MAVAMSGPGTRSASWPHVWTDQAALLERQHDRLEGVQLELLQRHDPQQPAWHLPLHQRIEERWLSAQGCLCAEHRPGVDAQVYALAHHPS